MPRIGKVNWSNIASQWYHLWLDAGLAVHVLPRLQSVLQSKYDSLKRAKRVNQQQQVQQLSTTVEISVRAASQTQSTAGGSQLRDQSVLISAPVPASKASTGWSKDENSAFMSSYKSDNRISFEHFSIKFVECGFEAVESNRFYNKRMNVERSLSAKASKNEKNAVKQADQTEPAEQGGPKKKQKHA